MISNDDIKREFLAAGFTIKPGHDDLKPYVYDAARRVLALAGHGGSTAWRCDCGANLYIDGEGRPRSKAEPWRHVRDEPPKMHARVFVVALDADDDPFVTTAHFNGFDKRGPIFLGAGKVRYTSDRWAPMLPLPGA